MVGAAIIQRNTSETQALKSKGLRLEGVAEQGKVACETQAL